MTGVAYRWLLRASAVVGLCLGIVWQSSGCFGCEDEPENPIELGTYVVASWRNSSEVFRPWRGGAEVEVFEGGIVIRYHRQGVAWEVQFARIP